MPNDADAGIEVLLDETRALNKNLSVLPTGRPFSTVPNIQAKKVTIRIGARPGVVDLVTLFAKSGRELPPQLAFYTDHYALWMITHSVNVMEEPGGNQIRQLGYEVRLPTTGRNPEFTIVSVLPRTEFIKKIGMKESLECSADLDLSGGAKLPDSLTQLLGEIGGFGGDVSASAKLRLSNTTSIVGRLEFNVSTPKVLAIGDGDTYCQWFLIRHDLSFVGTQTFIQIALLPDVTKKLRMEARASAIISSAFGLFPDKRQSEWVPLECKIP